MGSERARKLTLKCRVCKGDFPASPEYFYRLRTAKSGFTPVCKICTRKKRRSKKYRDKENARYVLRSRDPVARAKRLLYLYKNKDWCDYTVEELTTTLEQPCHYCGTTDENRGLDRLNNRMGHTKDNTVPACRLCNITRGNRFSPQEMIEIGKVITTIRQGRMETGQSAAQ